MAKLYFRYGTVGSAKTLNLLAVAHNYRQQGKDVLLIKPKLDTRFGKETIQSRSGLQMPADILLDQGQLLDAEALEGISCILIDEVQFLEERQIDQLRSITLEYNIPVLCYGLRTDFKTHLFPSAKRLLELSDSIEEIKATCHYCNKKSIFNLKHVDGMATNEGAVIELGCEEKYYPTCHHCYYAALKEALKMKAAARS